MPDTDVIETRGEYRAVVAYDPVPDPPHNDYGCPVVRIHDAGTMALVYGQESFSHDGIDPISSLSRFAEAHGGVEDGIAVFARWLRIWHGGDATYTSTRDHWYVAYTTRSMAVEAWGYDPHEWDENPDNAKADLSEWQAYLDGEVYLAVVQRHVLHRNEVVTIDDVHHPISAHEHESWDDVDGPVYGFYGEDHAKAEALLMLDCHAPKGGE